MDRTSWIKIDVGLLDDAAFSRLSTGARGAYVTAYLLQKRRGGAPFADHAELCRLLRKEGIDAPDVLVEEMREMLESPDPDAPGIGIRKYDQYQSWKRGPSDEPEAIRERVRKSREAKRVTASGPRDGVVTSRNERNEGVTTDETRLDKTRLSHASAGSPAPTSGREPATLTSFADLAAELPWLKVKPPVDGPAPEE